MASSGTITKSIRTGYELHIAWSVGTQSVADNTSPVTVKVQLVSTGSSYTINSSASKSGSLTINGTKYSFTFTAALSGNQTKTIYTKTVTVKHNADGTKTCAFSATAGIDVTLSGTFYGDVTASGNGTFDTIARASSISSVTSSVAVNGTNTVTVAISRASSSFTHTVVFKFGSYSKTTEDVETSTSYAIPVSWINAIPNATSGTATVTVTTYSGSTKIGTAVSKNFTLTVPSTVVPTISDLALSEAVSGINAQFGGYVQNKSKLAVKITASGVYSSTIKAYKTVILGKTYTAASFTSGVLTSSGSVSVAVTVTDSRGRTATKTSTVTVIAYKPPVIDTFKGARSLANGTENYDGTYLKAQMIFSISPVNNLNTKSYSIEYKLQSATTWTVLTSGSSYEEVSAFTSEKGFLSADNSYDIRLSVTDFFGTVRKTFEIPTAFTLLDFNASGHGLAFGKVSEKDAFECALPALFSHAETPSSATYLQQGQDLNDVLEPGFYAIPNTTVSTSLLNKPWTGTQTGTLIVTSEGNTNQRLQILHKSSRDDGAIYERCIYQGTWGAWHKVYSGEGTILWSGAFFMNGGQTIELSEPVSMQSSGIVLMFSRYSSSTAQNYHWNSFFVHKAWVKAHAGNGHQFFMTTDGSFSVIATKYLYIHDDKIGGNDNNEKSGTANGITYNNAGFVLRYVIGV